MTKMQLTNSQAALGYAIYMIGGSYFKKARCKNEIHEKGLRVQYFEQKLDKQYDMEERCINYFEKVILQEVPEELFDRSVEVFFKYLPDDKGCEVYFMCSKFILIVRGEFKGKGTKFSYELKNGKKKV